MAFVDPVRHCRKCAAVTLKEKQFFDEELKVLFAGAAFKVRSSVSISRDAYLFRCKLSNDERFLLFDAHDEEDCGEPLSPVDVCRIVSVETGDNQPGEGTFYIYT